MPFNSHIKASEFGLNDDQITDLLLDKLGFSPFIRKFTSDYRSLMIPKEDIACALEAVIKQEDDSGSTCRILEILYKHGYLQQLSKPIHFEDQLSSYVQMYLPDCPFEMNITYQYSAMPEACVTTRKPIDQGIIKYLHGFLVSLKEEEERDLDITSRNFTIVTSSRNRHSLLFLGPGRFVNHDCEANAELQPVDNGMQIIATRYIQVGQEITVKYRNHYFGRNNCDCLCATCASMGRNGWAAKEKASSYIPTIVKRRPRLRRLRVRDILTTASCSECQSRDFACFRCQRHARIYGYQWPVTGI